MFGTAVDGTIAKLEECVYCGRISVLHPLLVDTVEPRIVFTLERAVLVVFLLEALARVVLIVGAGSWETVVFIHFIGLGVF